MSEKLCTKCERPIWRSQDGVSEYDGSNLQHRECPPQVINSSKKPHQHQYLYVGRIGGSVTMDISDTKGSVTSREGIGYRFVCPVAGCKKPIKVVKDE